MVNYLKHLLQKIKEKTLKSKIILGILVFLYIIISLSCVIKINYVSTTPGGINRVESLIKVDGINDTGNIFTLSVYEYRQVTLLQYALAILNNDIDLEAFDPSDTLSPRDEKVQGQLMKEISIHSAIILAYEAAQAYDEAITIDYAFEGIIIHTTFNDTNSAIKLGDIIMAVDGVDVESNTQFYTLAYAALEDSERTTIAFDLKDKETVVQNIMIDGERRSIPIGVGPKYSITSTTPAYTLGASLTLGPSGGLMQALAVYNAITTKDVTQGLRIVGTGTIGTDGSVGKIGGIRQKIITAHLYKADIFFVASDNYDDALAAYNELKNPTFSPPIAITHFSDVIAYLEGLGE